MAAWKTALPGLVILVGYVLVLSPWFGRNLSVWGSLFPPGGSRALWVSEYEQTMSFPPSLLTPQSWLSAGLPTLLRARLDALLVVLQSALAVQGEIILFPFILFGLWRLRRSPEIQLGGTVWAVLTGIMVLVFPFASMNGSYFHSAAALQPLLWIAAPLGVETLSLKYASWRRLSDPVAMARFITIVVVAVCILLTGLLYFQRVVGQGLVNSGWGASDRHYRAVEDELTRFGAEPGASVLVNNPPGFWLTTGRPAIVIPYGGVDMLLAAAKRYHIRYLVLEQTNPWQLADLYHGKAVPPVLEYLSSVGTTRLYRIHSGE